MALLNRSVAFTGIRALDEALLISNRLRRVLCGSGQRFKTSCAINFRFESPRFANLAMSSIRGNNTVGRSILNSGRDGDRFTNASHNLAVVVLAKQCGMPGLRHRIGH